MAVASINPELLKWMRRPPRNQATLQGAIGSLYDDAKGAPSAPGGGEEGRYQNWVEGGHTVGGRTPKVSRLAETAGRGGGRSGGRLYSGVYL